MLACVITPACWRWFLVMTINCITDGQSSSSPPIVQMWGQNALLMGTIMLEKHSLCSRGQGEEPLCRCYTQNSHLPLHHACSSAASLAAACVGFLLIFSLLQLIEHEFIKKHKHLNTGQCQTTSLPQMIWDGCDMQENSSLISHSYLT